MGVVVVPELSEASRERVEQIHEDSSRLAGTDYGAELTRRETESELRRRGEPVNE